MKNRVHSLLSKTLKHQREKYRDLQWYLEYLKDNKFKMSKEDYLNTLRAHSILVSLVSEGIGDLKKAIKECQRQYRK